MALTNKQRAFVIHYLGDCRWNATKAAKAAGYANPHSQGSRLLGNVSVEAEINATLAAMGAYAAALRAQWVETGGMDISAHMTPDGIDVAGLIAAGKGHHIKGVTKTARGHVNIILHDPVKAQEMLAKSLGMFVDRKVLTGPGGGPIETKDVTEQLSDEEAGRRLLALLESGRAEEVGAGPSEEQHLSEDVPE